ncbi:SDR family oxidoreductase [Oxynema aestuarii]|jgi:short-subunit dehydrogenase|uniref:SDR family oxidoreductase n=1 Tax=Oxynema aestuarii AP17 TaxID=2064643 RepID=A0A6H1U1I5_9CYAN|nr:SDR family oxidoreductase [Oxynema aestuarii]QIZ71883.1 SDR family oxidoreductase [Oxynema aestuarii AP17]RMH72290.1 MAG: SDR family oxidoreductase [Cyanobacteria bacterium J007]
MSDRTPLRALITGASSGIGKATALALAKAGVPSALVSRRADRLAAVAAEAATYGVECKPYPVDLAKISQVRQQIGAIADDFGPIDLLINNAGMGYTGNLIDTPLSDWQRVMDLNLTSVFECIGAILPAMRDRQQGTILNVASVAAYEAFPGWGAYNVSKAALVCLSKTLAAEERANGIRVTIISPGAVNSPIWDTPTVNADFDRSQMLTPEIVAESIVHAALLPASAAIDELTLVSNAGNF